MKSKSAKKIILLIVGAVCICLGTAALAVSGVEGIGKVAATARLNLYDLASLITAAAYVAGMGFAVAAIVKFKAHKDNPTQVMISMPIALLFVAAALMFAPSVFKSAGSTLFVSGQQGGISGITSF